MSKRQELRERRRKVQIRRRLIAIGAVIVGALLITFVLILPGIRAQQNAARIIEGTPVVRKAAAHGTSLGDPNAPVKMDVWEDFQCIGCKRYSDSYEPAVITKYVDTGKVYYTYRFDPIIDGGAGESHQAANAALCANEQGKFWAYHDMLFANWIGENQGSFTNARLVSMAQTLNLDMAAFNACFTASKYAGQIQQDEQAAEGHNIKSTPGIFVNDVKVSSSAGEIYIPSVDDISKAIDAALGNH